ncbi:sialate O-acetylesterase [Rudanella lutea]|uniref:sialate O-acetylesterase n=1 Tax=Rudanella lutea TaxID=451374 RepID=UPI0003670496|nr:sialate O-acetylesterase [Rudanella lutea]
MNKFSLLWLLLWWPGMVLAQLNLTAPQSRIVYQRNGANQANIVVMGTAPQNATRVEARLVALTGGATTGWSPIGLLNANKAFRGSITGSGGWYRLEVRAWADGNLAAETSIDRVGVGEVFVIAGQSNAFGIQEAGGASDDRVSVVDFRDNDVNEQLLPMRFSHADGGGNVGPSNPLYIWGKLGDQLVSRLQVPVLFLGAAQPGTTSEEWRRSAEGDASLSGSLFPYRRLGSVLYHYIARTGVRAVLWHQGEGDIDRSGQAYIDNVRYVIDKSRQQANAGSMAWVVSRVSYTQGRNNPGIIQAQEQIINSVPNVFAGPNTDVLVGPENRFDDVHFGGSGLIQLIALWNLSLSNDFFSRSQPVSPSADAPATTAGYVLPNTTAPGRQIWVPYLNNSPGNSFKAQLLNSDGGVVTESSAGNQNPIALTLPGNLPGGNYRTRVVSAQYSVPGATGEVFRVVPGAAETGTQTPIQPATISGTADASISRLGYSYDMPSHGFHLLVSSSGPVEVRLERVDGGYFGETNWAPAGDNGEHPGFNKVRYYSPIAGGVGGVEPGRYRLSVRKAGDSGNGLQVEINLLNGRTTVFTTSDSTQPSPTTPTSPSVPTTPTSPPVTTTPSVDYVSQLGYKYDRPSHGFQLLVMAQGPVDLKLERLDGPFGETNWASGAITANFGAFNYFRNYSPAAPGVGGVEPGRYRLWARRAGTAGTEVSVEVTLQNGQFQAGVGTSTPTTTPIPQQPTENSVTPPAPTPAPVTGGSTSGQIRRIGYKYDMPSHGFQLLTDATGSVEVRLERLDGPFAQTNWGAVTASGEFGSYNGFRNYAPVAPGVGGVEAGRYRLSARLAGDTGNGQSVEITLGNGLFEAWAGSVTSPAPAPAQPAPQPTQPVTEAQPTAPTPTAPTGLIQSIGYKYDMPTHGFQLLSLATVAVQMRLERLDGSFADSNWGNATSSGQYNGYNNFRNYSPVAPGVGGVVPGRYRLSVRQVGDSGNGQSMDVLLQNGIFSIPTAPSARVAANPSAEEIIWQAYPNPAEAEVTVAYPASLPLTNVRTQLTSLAGISTDVPVQQAQPGKLRVSLGNLPAGLYILRVLDGNQPVQALKVIKR